MEQFWVTMVEFTLDHSSLVVCFCGMLDRPRKLIFFVICLLVIPSPRINELTREKSEYRISPVLSIHGSERRRMHGEAWRRTFSKIAKLHKSHRHENSCSWLGWITIPFHRNYLVGCHHSARRVREQILKLSRIKTHSSASWMWNWSAPTITNSSR